MGQPKGIKAIVEAMMLHGGAQLHARRWGMLSVMLCNVSFGDSVSKNAHQSRCAFSVFTFGVAKASLINPHAYGCAPKPWFEKKYKHGLLFSSAADAARDHTF